MAHLSCIFALVNYSINIKKVTIMEEIKNEQSRYEQAWSLYDKNKHEEAFKMFCQLAEEGDAESLYRDRGDR